MKKGSFFTKHSFTGKVYEDSLGKKYCSHFVTVGKCCEPNTGCDKNHVPFYRLMLAEKKIQYKYIRKQNHKIAINGDEVRGVPVEMKPFVQYPGRGEH